ncbi:MAG TPA: transglutaminase-like domain-containing protein [Chitinophagaceae bacterium]|jgi:regulator of sirC expression with transglutaminase-like and TPR domain
MEETKEISALFHLIDDPDEEVFTTVSERIVSLGKGIIPNLENLWENTPLEVIQGRIELLIHRLHYRDLTEEFNHWKSQPEQDLLYGALLVAKYQFPELVSTSIYAEVEKMRRNIWLELNSYLTALEQTNVITTILYNYYNIKGTEINYGEPNEFLINKVIDTKRGNAIANGIIYLILAELLDVPIRAINIPRQFILAYFDVDYNWQLPSNPAHKIQFYIDPMTGHVFTHKDVESYFKRISVPPTASYFKPMSHKRIIQFLLDEFSRCFDDDKNRFRQQELLILADSINE